MLYKNYGRETYNDNYGEEYGEYGRRGVPGTGRGRYRENYGRRGVPGTGRRYRGEEMMDDMYEAYQAYSDGRDMYNDSYGAKQETMESFKYMLKSFKDFFKHLQKEADSQEETELLKKTAKEISEM